MSALAKKTNILTLRGQKRKKIKTVLVTAYDIWQAKLADQAGVDAILVGDSLGMTTLGHETTIPVTMDDMIRHTDAVRKGTKNAFLIGDMPYLSYQISNEECVFYHVMGEFTIGKVIICPFSNSEWACPDPNIPDAAENDDFQIRKQRLEGYKIFMGTISRYNLKTSRIEPGTFTSVILRGGDLEENGDFQIKKCVAQDSSVPKVPKDEVPAPRRSSFLNSNTAHRGTGDA